MAFNSFRAGSGDYQYVRSIKVNLSAIPAGTTAVETVSAAQGNIATNGGSIADFTTDATVVADFDTPNASSLTGLILLDADINNTGEVALTFSNVSGVSITPAAGTQINFIVL